ncbi:tautomerase family protein [Lichenibacterium ramalinae]|uniref:Tautomerase family protein n=1 Tax=Lichenibacterium ramalinae TaxID=2316527 RepID=A0A4Q2RG14_9HYPH|nr:tautomerase family protein [Lichenibacterium ramalinae]RYB07127.1 tautomerase family protein [Lichenibacterium ramalinae]
MPLARIDLLRGKPPAHRAALRDGIHRALVATFEVPEGDRFAILTEHDPEDFVFDPSYLGGSRSADHVIVSITVSRTRGTAQKKALYAAIVRNLAEAPGLRPEDVTIILTENGREDWSFGQGIAQYVA